MCIAQKGETMKTAKKSQSFVRVFFSVIGGCFVVVLLLWLFFRFGVNRIEENPQIMQLVSCDDVPIKPSEYTEVRAYVDRQVMAQAAYFGAWKLDNKGCKKVTIENSEGVLLWDHDAQPDVLMGTLLMKRTIFPHTIAVMIEP